MIDLDLFSLAGCCETEIFRVFVRPVFLFCFLFRYRHANLSGTFGAEGKVLMMTVTYRYSVTSIEH